MDILSASSAVARLLANIAGCWAHNLVDIGPQVRRTTRFPATSKPHSSKFCRFFCSSHRLKCLIQKQLRA